MQVPAIKGLSYQDAETKLQASNLNIRVLATRCELSLQPSLVIEQNPQPGERVDRGYPVGVTIIKNGYKLSKLAFFIATRGNPDAVGDACFVSD
jgi:beta-lactam-binding protein with PASTA domain